ncbi:MAG: hypothetical protein ACUVWP_01305 [bacterium]
MGRLRELDVQIDQYARAILEEVNNDIKSRYESITMDTDFDNINFGLYITCLSVDIDVSFKPHLYC